MPAKKKTRLLFLIESLSGGGAEKVLSVLLKHLDSSRFEATLCCVVDTGKYNEEIQSYVTYTSILPNPGGLTSWWQKLCYRIKYKLVYNWLPLQMVYRLFVPQGRDVEIAFVEGFATRLLSESGSPARKIAWIHTDLVNNHWIEHIYSSRKHEQQSYAQYQAIVGVSETATRAFRQLYGNGLPSLTLYNPIDSQDILTRSQEPVAVPPKSAATLRLVSVGRFVPQKAFDRLLQIVHRLVQEQRNVELWLLGDGEERSRLEAYIHEHHLDSVVTLWGFQKNPFAYLAQCDLFVCSSYSEGYSTAVTEALILGLPVVTTDCSGMKELLGDNLYGVITPNEEEALYQGIRTLVDDPSLRTHYRNQAVRRGKDFSLASLMKPIEDLLAS